MGKRDRENRKKRTEVVYADTKKDIKYKEQNSGGGYTSLKIPAGCEIYKFKKKGNFKIDIMPYRVKHNPFTDVKKGNYHYRRTFYVHRNIGPDSRDYCCLQKNWSKPCPICEHVAKLTKSGGEEKLIGSLKPKERELFIFKDRDQKGKTFIFETGHYKSFGAFLLDKLDLFPKGHKHLNFWHLDKGMTLLMSTKEDSFDGRAFFPVMNIEFVDRVKPYSEDLLDKLPCLDDVLKELSYKELKKVFLQTGGVDDEADDKEAEEEDEGDDDEDSEGEDDGDEESSDLDDDDAGDEDEDGEEDSDSDDGEIDWDDHVGDDVEFRRNKKTHTGTLGLVKKDKGLVRSKKFGKKWIPLDKLTLVENADEEDDEDDDEENDD